MTQPTVITDPEDAHRRRWPIVLGVIVGVLLLAGFAASRIELNEYALAPGDAQPVSPRITVPPSRAHPVSDSVLLTDVLLSQVNLLTWLPDRLDSNTAIIPAAELLGPSTPPDQLEAQGYVEMAQSQAAAKAAALRHLGYTVPERDAGALVFAVAPGSPAAGALGVADVITGVDGTQTPNTCAFVAALHPIPAGHKVVLDVEPTTITPSGKLVQGAARDVSVRLAPRPSADQGSTGCPGVTGPSGGLLGVDVETQQDFTYPFPVAINTTDIGGPSAGLAMTLGIMDKLSTGDLTGRHVVAATGTIDASGDVGDVGGVAQKTIAVERAGATVFFVPPEEYSVARSKATSSLHVYSVSTLDQALHILRSLGGSVPAAATSG
jgi:PDZ domain-containing protein